MILNNNYLHIDNNKLKPNKFHNDLLGFNKTKNKITTSTIKKYLMIL